MSTIETTTVNPTAPLASIVLGDNVRDLDTEHVDNLAASIELIGLLSPITVRPLPDGTLFLVAGHHRHAACMQLGLEQVQISYRESEDTSAGAAVENIARKQLSPLEEARAVKAMFDQGLTSAGAAKVLGWSKQLVTQRAKILELPETAQAMLGDGRIPLRGVDQLLRIQPVAPDLVTALVQTIADGELDGGHLNGNLGWALGRAMRHTGTTTFARFLNTVDQRDAEELKLGKKALAALADAEAAHRKLNQHTYGPPRIDFDDAEIDRARAAGVLLELENTPPVIVDLKLYRELCKQAIHRTADQLAQRLTERAEAQREIKAERSATPKTPKEQLDIEHRAQIREHSRQAHPVNLDLGTALMTGLATVDPADINVARFFAYGLLGPDRRHHMGVGENVARTLAANGLRLVLDEHRSTETPTLKSGAPGRTKVTYGDVDAAQAWLWKFVDGAKTAGELYGRVIVVFAAQHYAHQLALPTAQRRGSMLPGSHKDLAAKAFEKIAKPILPATHKQLSAAIKRESTQFHKRAAVTEQEGYEKRAAASEALAAAASRNSDDGEDVATVNGQSE